MLKEIVEYGSYDDKIHTLQWVIKNGDVEMAQWILDNTEIDPNVLLNHARVALDNEAIVTEYVMNLMYRNFRMKELVLEYLPGAISLKELQTAIEQKVDTDPNFQPTLQSAVTHGYPDIVRYFTTDNVDEFEMNDRNGNIPSLIDELTSPDYAHPKAVIPILMIFIYHYINMFEDEKYLNVIDIVVRNDAELARVVLDSLISDAENDGFPEFAQMLRDRYTNSNN